jgi:hypothetical protein
LGFGPIALHFISGSFAVIGNFLFLRFSPFPLFIRLCLPFTYFALYQYSVIARSYSLIPVSLFAIAMLYKQRHKYAATYVLALCLLSQIHIMTTIIAIVLYLSFLYEQLNLLHLLTKQTLVNIVSPFLLFSMNVVFIIAVMFPVHRSEIWVNKFNFQQDNFSIESLLVDVLDKLNEALSGMGLLTLAIVVLSIIYCYRQKTLIVYSLGIFLLLLFLGIFYGSSWHEGIVFYYFIFSMWIATNNKPHADNYYWMSAMLSIVLTIQISWAVAIIRNDALFEYAPGKSIASYILQNNLAEEDFHTHTHIGFTINYYLPELNVLQLSDNLDNVKYIIVEPDFNQLPELVTSDLYTEIAKFKFKYMWKYEIYDGKVLLLQRN